MVISYSIILLFFFSFSFTPEEVYLENRQGLPLENDIFLIILACPS